MPGGIVRIPVRPDLDDWPRQLGDGLRRSSGIASTAARGIGLAVAAGITAGAVGIGAAIKLGNEYASNLNELQAVSGATGAQMVAVGNAARALGSDLSLPATSGADAAAVMLELTKGGLSLQESMEAARGTIQLAAAAQIEGAAAAEIQSAALNQFQLKASDASLVADVLANTANAASGSITDIALALKYVGPVAASVGISIQDTASAIGLLANNGIQADNAGTALRGMLASLAAPSKEARGAISDLGIVAFDEQGKFVGLRTVIDELSAAQARMTDEQFASAAATAFGREPLSAITALATGGAKAFDDMATAVGRQGGAADVAAAKTQGLGGALDKLQSQAEDAALGVYEAIAPTGERIVLALADATSRGGDAVAKGLETAIAAAEVYGPRIAESIRARASVIGDAITDVVGPIASGTINPLNSALNTSIGLWDNLTGALDNTVDAARPVAESVGEFTDQAAEGSGVVGTLATVVGGLGDTVENLSGVLVPVGHLLGGAIGLFTDLPGPVQTAALALVAYRLAQGKLSTFDPGGLRQFSGEMRVQRELARAGGEEISRLGSAVAAYRTSTIPAVAATRNLTDQIGAIRTGAAATGEPIGRMSAAIAVLAERSPAIGAIKGSFDQAASGVTRFGTAAGLAAASGTALRVGAGALVSALGGPVGIAIGAVTVGLALLSGRQADAAQRTAEHASRVDGLAAALRESNGQINESVRAHQAQAIQATKVGDSERSVADAARDAGISLSELTDATLGNDEALAALRTRLQGVAEANKDFATAEDGSQAWTGRYNDTGQAALDLLGAIDGLAGGTKEAQRKQRELDEALRDGRASMIDGTDAGRSLGSAMKILSNNTSSADDKARALKDALDALSGGTVNLEAAQSRVNDQVSRLNDLFGDQVDKTKGWGDALLNANGSINTTTSNGRQLFDTLQSLSTSTAEVATKTYEMARANGADVPTAMAAAAQSVQRTRDALIAQHDAWGLTAEQVEKVLDRYGLVPSEIATLISQPGMDKAQLELLLLKAKAEDVPGAKSITVSTLSEDAVKKLEAVGFKVNSVPGGKEIVLVGNDTDFNAKLAEALKTERKNVFIDYYTGRTAGPNVGQANLPLAAGGVVAAAYASGGVHRLTPMRGGLAAKVPPNTWRIIGDRVRGTEYYLPDDDAPRSLALGMEWAQNRGLALVRMFANGGIAVPTTSAQQQVASLTGPTINNYYQVPDAASAQEVGRVASAQTSWNLRFLR